MLVCKVKKQLTEERALVQTARAVPAHQSRLLPRSPLLTLLSAYPPVSPAATVASLCWRFHATLLPSFWQELRGLHLAQHPSTGFTSSQWGGLEPDPRAHHPGLGAASPAPLCRVQ